MTVTVSLITAASKLGRLVPRAPICWGVVFEKMSHKKGLGKAQESKPYKAKDLEDISFMVLFQLCFTRGYSECVVIHTQMVFSSNQ